MPITLFRRHPALLAAVEEVSGQQRRITVSVNDARPPLLVDDARLLAALSSLPANDFTQATALKAWAEAGLGDIQTLLWTYCTETAGLIVAAAGIGPHRHDAYHQATRCYPFLDMGRREAFDIDNTLMRQYMGTDAYPEVYTELPHTQRRPLAKAETVTSAPGGEDRLPEHLALLLDGTLGERRRLDASDSSRYLQVELLFKAVPSGGARHPTEALLWLRAEGMPEGLYHYNVRANALDLLHVQPDLTVLADACPALPALTKGPGPLAVVMLASVVQRPMWRYRDPRSARAVLVDVGHVLQHLVELGAWLGWTFTDLPGFDARALAEATGVDADAMPVLAMGALHR